ncbi:MAG TPA: ATP-binding cassette domain-containing protein, partial [Streptomyces sp.]
HHVGRAGVRARPVVLALEVAVGGDVMGVEGGQPRLGVRGVAAPLLVGEDQPVADVEVAVGGRVGMHTVLSDGGGAVSGGQRQRLMIAQAMIRRPRILFFDEATSALDNETQRVVIDSTRQLRATRVVIAHRLSTIMDADRVVVMAEGRVAQQGRPADLLADTGGLFHELVRRQLR